MNALHNIKQKPFNNICEPAVQIPKKVIARQLQSHDFMKFKKIRLRSLKEEEHCFAASYAHENKLPKTHWVNECSPTKDKSFFGLFNGTNLIGFMFAKKWDQDSSNQTAYWGSAYIIPEYRGTGLGKALYQQREKWTKKHPSFTKCIFGCFERNTRSKAIHLKHGAKYLFTRTLKTSGRPDTPLHYYGRAIKPKLRLIA